MIKKYLPLINLTLIAILSFCVHTLMDEERFPAKGVKKNYVRIENPESVIEGVANVIDGDSIKIDGNRIRFLSIDAPESKQKCLNKNDVEYFCGKMSTNFLKSMADKKVVKCIYKKKDFYNRFLSYCSVGDKLLNLEMVKNGMAVIYGYKNAPQGFSEAESYAQDNKLGIWQGSFEPPKDYRKRTKNRRKK